MGQQQLLLLVLGIVIVGLAVVVGISAFNESKRKATVDRYTAMGVGMAGEVIAWHLKPTAQGGGGGQISNFAGLTMQRLGYTQTGVQSGSWGTRTGLVQGGIQRWLTIGNSGTHPYLHITDDPVVTGMTRVEVHVFGPKAECVVTRHDIYGAAAWSDGSSADVPANPNSALCPW